MEKVEWLKVMERFESLNSIFQVALQLSHTSYSKQYILYDWVIAGMDKAEWLKHMERFKSTVAASQHVVCIGGGATGQILILVKS